ncbi:MAG: hypothetical protein O7C59_03920 [Rickettsia endosymbiont of Ixodes persulcatus]|nr:hypothetical protein [Rickettsia endosymbiont of Ixodes persulcatus]MCZ6908378.1 hypothetical protein [Rickettsia endosymbiont of Ixodes persulcatus]MCZ6911123.1 hypothetical protein [Rickettsia endosymbiont of Ixodes persulcatus]MCZ6913700.1 hypothetical protein [Rickettsia endosymbiont of Ixodes persulcatus]MCZ6925219.1 hypothetical protein [Rickettsia endosymbiont of Ixodes persulcatus]
MNEELDSLNRAFASSKFLFSISKSENLPDKSKLNFIYGTNA